MYHKSFVDSYFSRLHTAVENKILSATKDQLKPFDKQMLEDIDKRFWEICMDRLWTAEESTVNKKLLKAKIGVFFLK